MLLNDTFELIDINNYYFVGVKVRSSHVIFSCEIDVNETIDFNNEIKLSGHKRKLYKIFLFMDNNRTFLLSLCDSQVLLWDFAKIYKNTKENGTSNDCLLLFNNKASISTFTIFAYLNHNLFIGCSKREILVFPIKMNSVCKDLNIKTHTVQKSELFGEPIAFTKENHVLICMICSDRSFIIVNYSCDMQLIYKSSVLSCGPLSCNIVSSFNTLLISSLCGELFEFHISGQLIVYESNRVYLYKSGLFTGNIANINNIHIQIDNNKRWTSSSNKTKPTALWNGSSGDGDAFNMDNLNLAVSNESLCGIYKMLVFTDRWRFQWYQQLMKYLEPLNITRFLLVSTLNGLFILNASTCEVIYYECWLRLLLGNRGDYNILFNNQSILFHDQSTQSLYKLTLEELKGLEYIYSDTTITIQPEESLREDSVLQNGLILPKLKVKNQLVPKSYKKTNINNNSMNKPLTFNSIIRSSGYAKTEPTRKLFEPRRNSYPSNKIHKKDKPIIIREYPTCSLASCNLQSDTVLDTENLNISSISMSTQGQRLVCCFSNGSNQLISTKSFKTIQSNQISDKLLSCSNLSLEDKLILFTNESSVDLWSVDKLKCMLTINKEPNETLSTKNQFRDSRFFLLDRFIQSSFGSKFKLWNYCLDQNFDEIKRYKNNSKFKKIYEWNSHNDSSITSSASINHFYSYLCLIATVDYSINILDLNVGKVVNRRINSHDRRINNICINAGSTHSSLTQNHYNCFATSTETDIKLWDVRISNHVQKYIKNSNTKVRPCDSLKFLPNGNYLIAGGWLTDSLALIDLRWSNKVCDVGSIKDDIVDFCCDPAFTKIYCATRSTKLLAFNLSSNDNCDENIVNKYIY